MSGQALLDTIAHIIRISGDDPIWASRTALLSLLQTIPHLPYSIRKHLLDCTRIQASQHVNQTLYLSYSTILTSILSIPLPPRLVQDLQIQGVIKSETQSGSKILVTSVFTEHILQLFENFYDSPTACTILSYMVRAERTRYPEQFTSIGNQTLLKEITASQQTNLPQQLNYQALFTEERVPLHIETSLVPLRMAHTWKDHIHRMIEHMTDSKTILLPHYNAEKNVGHETQSMYFESSGRIQRQYSVTTLDLLKYYAQTGVAIQGPMELRQAWRFNDLKPRSYYCLGGNSFWASLYIKQFSKELISAFQSTHPFSRYEVRRITRLRSGEILVTYDYSSFTTSLAELKYFMWYIATQFLGVMVQILDVHSGIQTIDFGQYLQDYNETVNHHQLFDISRIVDSPEVYYLHQNRNGSLGTGGNISLSGLNHGISLGGFNDSTDTDSVVGDDALLKILAESLTLLFTIINKLGSINIEKITTIPVPEPQDDKGQVRTSFKYLKRPISVNPYGEIETGTLDFFPNIASCLFPYGDGIHDPPLTSIADTVRACIMQIGKYLTNLLREHISEDPDVELALTMLRSVYHKYNLPTEGAIPTAQAYCSGQMNKEGQSIQVWIEGQLWIPPLDTLEVFHTPWMRILLDRFSGQDVTTPHMVEGEIPLPIDAYPGLETQTTDNGKFSTLLKDFGFIDLDMVMQRRTFDEAVMEEAIRDMSIGYGLRGDLRPMYIIKYLEIPSYYREYVLSTYGDTEYPPEYWDTAAELESIGLYLDTQMSD